MHFGLKLWNNHRSRGCFAGFWTYLTPSIITSQEICECPKTWIFELTDRSWSSIAECPVTKARDFFRKTANRGSKSYGFHAKQTPRRDTHTKYRKWQRMHCFRFGNSLSAQRPVSAPHTTQEPLRRVWIVLLSRKTQQKHFSCRSHYILLFDHPTPLSRLLSHIRTSMSGHLLIGRTL